MKAIDRPFPSIINGASQFLIPVFQRDYTWNAERQCLQLWSDVIRAAGDGAKEGHFLGSIVYISTGDTSAGFTRWLLIDGQQRLTTLTILLIALRDHIDATNWVGDANDPTSKRIDAYFLRNVQEEGDRQQKLVLRRRDQLVLSALIDRKEVPESASIKVLENYQFFRDQLRSGDPSTVYKGLNRLKIVDVTLDRGTDDPQSVFESLNATGVRLSQSDLIRNYILMRLPEKEQTALYNNYWSKVEELFNASEGTFDSFVRDFVALKTEATKQERSDNVYKAFQNFFPGLCDQTGSISNALSELMRYARYYAAFSLGIGVSGDRATRLSGLRRLVDVPALLVMRLFECADQIHSMTENEFQEALLLIESYVMRRAICGFQTRGYWQVFSSIAYKLGDHDTFSNLKVAFARQRESYRFPTDDEFGRSLREAEIYGLRVCRNLLEGLENFSTRELSDVSGYSIEHILPQNERLSTDWKKMLGEHWRETQKTWVHRLGNLTLTGYNSKYSDRSFSDKKTISNGFNESAVRLNRSVRDQPVWTAVEIEGRTVVLAQMATGVWPMLSVSKNLVEASKHRDTREQEARRDVSKVEMSFEARSLFDALRQRVVALGEAVVELAEQKSISYHSPAFFLEVLPRRYRLTLLLALDFNEVVDQSGIAEDATQWEFFTNATYEGGVMVKIDRLDDIEKVLPLLRQAYESGEQ